VLFGQSAAGTLRQVLQSRGASDEVAGFGDDLSFGPLGSIDERIAWFDRECPDLESWDWLRESHDRFWAAIEQWEGPLRVWLAPASAAENCGYHAFRARAKDRPAAMTVSRLRVTFGDGSGGALGLGSHNADEIAELLDGATIEPCEDPRAVGERWRALSKENTGLRIVNGDLLISAPEDHFDHLLLAAGSNEWRKAMRVVADAMVAGWDLDHQVSDTFLALRLRTLVEAGVIESDGPIHGEDDSWRTQTKVRLAQR